MAVMKSTVSGVPATAASICGWNWVLNQSTSALSGMGDLTTVGVRRAGRAASPWTGRLFTRARPG
jgi:hypothetical protein